MDLFAGLGNEDNTNPIEVLMRLLDPKDIEMITDLNMSQIHILSELKYHQELDKTENRDRSGMDILVNEVIPYLLKLMVSNRRKSREETIKGVSELKDTLLESSLLASGLIPRK